MSCLFGGDQGPKLGVLVGQDPCAGGAVLPVGSTATVLLDATALAPRARDGARSVMRHAGSIGGRRSAQHLAHAFRGCHYRGGVQSPRLAAQPLDWSRHADGGDYLA